MVRRMNSLPNSGISFFADGTTFNHNVQVNLVDEFMSKKTDAVTIDIPTGDATEQQDVPKRINVRTKMRMMLFTLTVVICLTAWCEYQIITIIINKSMYYLTPLIVIIPLGMFYFSFAVNTAVNSIFCLVAGPVRPLEHNSQFYSAIKTPIPQGAALPPILIQMPVYKESLDEVIAVTFNNVKKAMAHYVSMGGQVKFFICDDGMQLISKEDAKKRIEFYRANDIVFVARPPTGRQGLFKKASNMNYSMYVAERVKDAMAMYGISYDHAMHNVWQQHKQEFVADGDIRISDDTIILLIDADTKVPETCMWDTVGEFLACDNLSYTQHFTTPFADQNRNYWENMISHFTRKIYFTGIALSTALGDTSPLVGHNAFLRWSAMKKVGFFDKADGKLKYWSEDNVSEDFDMFMRLSTIGTIGRYVTYTGDDFQEGVSLSFMDEIIKFRKFAYGACELCFNPLYLWPVKGPFHAQFIKYIFNKHITWFQKLSLVCYLSTFFAMASAFPFCIFEGVMSIIHPELHDKYMVRAFDVMLTCVIIFGGMSTVSGVVLNWRFNSLKAGTSLFKIIWNELKWIPMIALFFNSMLFHMTTSTFCYFFSVPIVWGSTVKEAQNPTCFQALKNTILSYWKEYIVYFVMTFGYLACVIIFKIDLYRAWNIISYGIGHMLGPILLNPHIMSLSY